MTTYPILLAEATGGRLADAVVTVGLSAARMIEAETAWAPVRRAQGGEHGHWDWALKTGFLAEPGVLCIGIECRGRIEGMALVETLGDTARADPDAGRPLVYVDFLEAAPWNLRAAADWREYGDVGRRLLDAAIRLSRDLGYDGRIGLHSLPQSEGFYRDAAGMPDFGPDAGYHWLVYFEFTAAEAAGYLPEA